MTFNDFKGQRYLKEVGNMQRGWSNSQNKKAIRGEIGI